MGLSPCSLLTLLLNPTEVALDNCRPRINAKMETEQRIARGLIRLREA
jgi:hypothetical protein